MSKASRKITARYRLLTKYSFQSIVAKHTKQILIKPSSEWREGTACGAGRSLRN